MTKDAVEQEAADQDSDEQGIVPIQKARPKKDKSTKGGGSTVLAVLAVVAAVGAVYEFRRAEGLAKSLSQATESNAQLQLQVGNQGQELKATNAKLAELARRNLPVSIIFRPSQSGNGITTFFKNNAPSPVDIGVILSNPATERRREVNLNLPANGLLSIGEADGWVFAPGHHIQVTHADYGTVQYVVPDKP